MLQNDVWITTNYGQTWVAQTMAAPWYARENPNVVVAQNGMIALNGGSLCSGYGCYPTTQNTPYANAGWLSDVWVSFDIGVSWQQMASSSNSLFAQAATVTDSNGYWYTIAGQTGPANNTYYAWTNSGYKSSFSLTAVTQWGSAAGLRVPSSFANVLSAPLGLCPANQPSCSSASSSSSSGLSNGAIAGIVIGSVVGAALLLLICFTFGVQRRGGERDTGKKVDSIPHKGKFAEVEESAVSRADDNNVEMN